MANETHITDSSERDYEPEDGPVGPDKRALLLGLGGVALLLALLVLSTWGLKYVPAGKMLVVVSKTGEAPEAGEVLAGPGQKGIRKEVLGEGWHFVWPLYYTTELHPNTVVPAGKVGIVTSQSGKAPAGGSILTDSDDEKGIRRAVLVPGTYRLNPYAVKVEMAEATEIKPGFVGVKRRLLGKDSPTQFAEAPDQKGILRNEVLQPGIYFVNTKEYEVLPCEVGIYQVTYLHDKTGKKNSAITFPVQDGYHVSLDCTIEWELRPENWPELIAKYGNKMAEIAKAVVKLNAEEISRTRGLNYGVEDFLRGEKREKFQEDFRTELDKVCKEHRVLVRSAFIRNIIIPEGFLAEKRDQRVAIEKRLTSEAKTKTAISDARVKREEQAIEVEGAKVKAETDLLVAVKAREKENVVRLTEAELEQLRAAKGAEIAEKDAERREVLGKAEADAKKMRDTARAELYKMKVDAFGKDGDAFLRYSLSQGLDPKLRLRLFQSGPGTLWTNLGNKDLNLMLPLPGAGAPLPPTPPPGPVVRPGE